MNVWQADFYRRPLHDATGNPLWELAVCDPTLQFQFSEFCPQSSATANWLTEQLRSQAEQVGYLPQVIQVFRPQTAHLMALACDTLGITLEQTRRTPTLKQWLKHRALDYPAMATYNQHAYDPVQLEQLPPSPLPAELWGEQWRFGAIAAGDLELMMRNKPIPICSMPDELLPLSLKIASATAIPGVIIDGGRQSMRLARWLQSTVPAALHYVPGSPHGLILEAGLVDRWVVATFEDPEMITAAQTYQTRWLASKNLHFLLIQPDNSGMTYSGFWLLQGE